MAAGGSAEEQASRARRAAAKLGRKAAYASHVADNYERGAAGERAVADALAPLEAKGWRILHDLVDPEGGNIDHLAVGPPGIAVIDAKNWSSAVSVTADRRLVTGGKDDRSKELTRLLQRVELVRRMVAVDGMHVAVRGYLVLCGERDRSFDETLLGDLRVVGIDGVAGSLGRVRDDLDPGVVAPIADTLEARLADRIVPADGVEASALTGRAYLDSLDGPTPLFERAHRIYYSSIWKKAGHFRLYLKDSSGTRLGWTDMNTGATSIECTGVDQRFAEVLLAAAAPTGVKVAPGELPTVATQIWGGRLLSKIARLHTSVLVGQEWRNYGKHRLYGVLLDPQVEMPELGYIDLKDHTMHALGTGPIAKDRASAERYLGFLWKRMPPPPEPRAKR